MDTDNNALSKKLVLKYFSKGCAKLFFMFIPNIDAIFIKDNLLDIFNYIKMKKSFEAKKRIKDLTLSLPIDKIAVYYAKLSQFLSSETIQDIPEISKFSGYVYTQEIFTEIASDLLKTINAKNILDFLDLAVEEDNISAAANELLYVFLAYFKALGPKEPAELKKIREEIEYVFLIQMYLQGSKELPERKTDNFNYALLSEFLKKDDLVVLKSIEDYLDSAENKALGAAGAVAQSIEKEDLEPGVKKVKKDIERIEKLED